MSDLRSDREELEILRVSVARIAQMIGADSRVKIKEQGFQELCRTAHVEERGWNALAADICDKIEDMIYQRNILLENHLDRNNATRLF
jgi:hypothetical protein